MPFSTSVTLPVPHRKRKSMICRSRRLKPRSSGLVTPFAPCALVACWWFTTEIVTYYGGSVGAGSPPPTSDRPLAQDGSLPLLHAAELPGLRDYRTEQEYQGGVIHPEHEESYGSEIGVAGGAPQG